MGATKNIIRGTIFTAVYVTTTIVIPFLLFNWVKYLKVPELGIDIKLTQEDYEKIIFWIMAFGLLISGCAFFTYSSPKQSIRRGIFALIQVLLNCLYLWSYKFSGATEIVFDIDHPDDLFTGFLSLDLETMILIYMGVYFLTIVLKIYDVFDFTINREKIREDRMKK